MNVQRQIDQLIALQAAQWYEQLKDGSHERNAEFIRWVTESPRNMEAFLAVASEAPLVRKVLRSGVFDQGDLLRRMTPEVVPLSAVGGHALSGNQNDVHAFTGTDAANGVTKPIVQRLRLASWVAAAAAVVVTAFGVLLHQTVLSWQRFETSVGEQRTIQLTEGSVVNMNAVSRVDVRIDESARDIRLLRGEATFKVAPDPMRPFRVHTPDAIVEAVGTQFNVYARSDGTTTVSVLEGKVRVSRESSGFLLSRPVESVPVSAGEEARVRAGGHIERRGNVDIAEAVAWQQRKLIFKRTPLDEMAAEFNRYNKATQIRLEGIEPGRFRFTGAFNADDPHSLAALLAHEPDLAVTSERDEIVIRPRLGEGSGGLSEERQD